MANDHKNPLGMVPDPYDGSTFVLPKTHCTQERKIWFRRANEIFGFQLVAELALKECKNRYGNILSEKGLKPDTPFKIASSDGRSVMLPARKLLFLCDDGINVLYRQIFIMFYGSFETYMFDILGRSFGEIKETDNILEKSVNIMMRGNWDGKLCKMNSKFSIGYKAGELEDHFKGYEMEFEGNKYFNPLAFLDELAQVRHKIIHASSVIEDGRFIFINSEIFNSYYGYFAHLTDYIDRLFSDKFGYERLVINPGEA